MAERMHSGIKSVKSNDNTLMIAPDKRSVDSILNKIKYMAWILHDDFQFKVLAQLARSDHNPAKLKSNYHIGLLKLHKSLPFQCRSKSIFLVLLLPLVLQQ